MEMNKKEFSEREFNLYIDSEILAYQVYREIVRNKADDEYVDAIANTYCENYGVFHDKLPIYHLANKILKNDYGVDMLSLPFLNEDTKWLIEKDNLNNEIDIKI